jgi:hypothetical protein
MVNSHHTQANRERIINTQQSGAASEPTLPEKIAFYDGEIKKAKGWISYYTNPRKPKNANPKMAATHAAMVASFEKKREALRALLYVQQLDEAMPTFGGAMKLAGVK